jgi:hypothetical protein
MAEEELTSNIERVAGVLQQLKSEVRRQHRQWLGTGMLDDPGVAGGKRPAALEAARTTMQVNPHLPIAWPTWPHGLWPKAVAVGQKLVRRLLRWYINPIVEQQNRHNAAVCQALDVLWMEMMRLKAQLAEQQQGAGEGEQQP